MKKRSCPSCGAPLKNGTDVCPYCDVEYYEPSEESSESIPYGNKINTPKKIGSSPLGLLIFIVLLFFCGPFALIYMWIALPWSKQAKGVVTLVVTAPLILLFAFGAVYETIYAVRMDVPKISKEPLPLDKRVVKNIQPGHVYSSLRGLDDRSLQDRKKEWRDKYEGRWVIWRGTVTSTETYTTSASSIHLSFGPDTPYDVEAFFDPLENDKLKKINKGDQVQVNGRLWGYYMIGDTIRLGDCELINVRKATEGSEKSEG